MEDIIKNLYIKYEGFREWVKELGYKRFIDFRFNTVYAWRAINYILYDGEYYPTQGEFYFVSSNPNKTFYCAWGVKEGENIPSNAKCFGSLEEAMAYHYGNYVLAKMAGEYMLTEWYGPNPKHFNYLLEKMLE